MSECIDMVSESNWHTLILMGENKTVKMRVCQLKAVILSHYHPTVYFILYRTLRYHCLQGKKV